MLPGEEELRSMKTLEEYVGFRYAVAGYLGLSEILKRLDAISGEQTKIWSEIARIWVEIKALREGYEGG